jgi:hypothetical protein
MGSRIRSYLSRSGDGEGMLAVKTACNRSWSFLGIYYPAEARLKQFRNLMMMNGE